MYINHHKSICFFLSLSSWIDWCMYYYEFHGFSWEDEMFSQTDSWLPIRERTSILGFLRHHPYNSTNPKGLTVTISGQISSRPHLPPNGGFRKGNEFPGYFNEIWVGEILFHLARLYTSYLTSPKRYNNSWPLHNIAWFWLGRCDYVWLFLGGLVAPWNGPWIRLIISKKLV